MSMRTPLSRIRGLGSAHHGTGHFWLQRLTAAANVFLLVVLIGIVVTLVGRTHATVISTLSKPLVSVLFVAAIISVAIHMRIGMQVVIEDYVHTPFRKVVLLMLNTFFAWAVGLASVYAILRISFGP
jgi:succinate dehydrogenase / fumarate reductase membrane anchor subunit